MDIRVTFRHLEQNDALRNYAQEKVLRIEKYVSNITEVHVILSLEKRSHIAEVIVNVTRDQITAKQVNEDNMYTAIDLVMDKIDRQVKKYKDKITRHKDQHRKARHNVVEASSVPESQTTNIIKTESVFIQHMTADEALLKIELTEDDFFVFKNAETDKVNVLYKRRDGDFGLIEPENS
ncbi:ribosome hibernation-promoting factor, HPF/YfiA family [Thermodesulfobacteriota bacterium]